MNNILYSYALDAEGKRQSINETDAPRQFQCGDCYGEMVARRGKVNRWHYAHKSQVVCEPKPDPDNALHCYAQDIIYDAFLRHQADGTEYGVGVRCAGLSADPEGYGDHCNNPVAKNAAVSDAKIFKEHVLVPNTRSDLVIQILDGKGIILEVVNTHAPEPETRDRYRASGYPVVIKKVSWELLDELHTEVIADDSINVPSVRCDSCKARKLNMEREEAERQDALQRGMNIIDTALARLTRRHNPTPAFQPWYQVLKPNWDTGRPVQMYPKTQRPVFANAIILTELGFKQLNKKKPYLFSYGLGGKPKNKVLYADIGGSEDLPIYKDTAAMLYTFDLSGDLKKYVITEFGQALQKAGVNVRTGFESSAYMEERDIDPTRHVSKAMLDGLVHWFNTCKLCHSMSVLGGRCRQCGYEQGDQSDEGVDEDMADSMGDYPGKPVKSPRRWVSDGP